MLIKYPRRTMKKITTILALTAVSAFYLPLQAQNIVTTSTKSAQAAPPSFLTDDLGQTAFGSISDNNNVSWDGRNVESLFNGNISDAVRIEPNASFTLNFDLTSNPDGFDIARIITIAGWDTAQGGRSNQGYGIELFFVDPLKPGGTFLAKETWEPNDPASFWTVVTHASNDGSALDSGLTYTDIMGDEVPLTATGVSAIRFTNFDASNAGNSRTFWREIDIVAVPEPSTILLLLGAAGVLWIRRNRLKGL